MLRFRELHFCGAMLSCVFMMDWSECCYVYILRIRLNIGILIKHGVDEPCALARRSALWFGGRTDDAWLHFFVVWSVI